MTITVGPNGFQQDARFRDDAQEVRAGQGCTQIDLHDAKCDLGGADETHVRAIGSALSDRLSIAPDSAGGAELVGGRGNDVLTGGAYDDALNGGPGSDVLSGGGGNDLLVDGDGKQARDVVAGGPGRDEVSYWGRRDGVTVDLPKRVAGARGERDALSGVEAAVGGAGGDLLIGTNGPDRLNGGPGDDTLLGGRGSDHLFGGAGRDRLRGGSGRDFIWGGTAADTLAGGPGLDVLNPDDEALPDDGAPDRLSCSSGADRIEEAARQDVVSPECSRVALFDTLQEIRTQLPVRSRRATVAALHGAECGPPACHAVLRIVVAPGERRVRAGTVLGRVEQRGPVGPGRPAVRLSASGARLVKRYPGLLARITFVTRYRSISDHGGFLTRVAFR